MKIEVKIPAVGESITEATIGSWNKKSGEAVKRNEVILLLETDKASVEVVAEQDGVLTIQVEAGQTLPIGSTVGVLDTEAKATVASATAATPTSTSPASAPAAGATAGSAQIHHDLKSHLSPATQRVVSERGLDAASIEGTGRGGRLTKEDALKASTAPAAAPSISAASATTPVAPMVTPSKGGSKQGSIKRVPMTNIRKKIAERLVEAQHTAAILTTFNEIDMTNVIALRDKYKDKFKEKYGVSLGMMGFFTKSVCEALKAFPAVNASIEGTDLVYKNFFNIGVAVSTEKGLIVPIIKDADMMTIAEVEMAIRQFALKARDGKITVDDLSGGTFTISNGGVFGSLMSTPILTPPQVGILGMHKVEDRAVVIDKKIEIRSMMYVALSYDHRIIDGKEAVGFLVRVKECIENPERLLLEI
jgi:2-oxoglutarate dehydrogenase E2 component (dihydrolipoamide succinyltransferase)